MKVENEKKLKNGTQVTLIWQINADFVCSTLKADISLIHTTIVITAEAAIHLRQL